MRLLLVEDDVMVASGIKLGLTDAGYAVDWVGSGERAEEVLRAESFDAAIIDIGLPAMDGLELTRRLRRPDMASPAMPVLILTARDALHDRVQGLDLGADDYLVKPFAWDELLARLRALLRRERGHARPRIVIGDLEIDLVSRSVKRAAKPIHLTAREFMLLQYLAQRAGQVVSRSDISKHLYGEDDEASSNVVDVYIGYLRNKIDKPYETRLIHTRRGAGYQMSAEE